MSFSIRKCMLYIVLAATLTGCASEGKNFKYKNISQLKLGDKKSLNYQKIFGKPLSMSKISNSDGEFEQLHYKYSHGDMAVIEDRSLELEFRNGELNAYWHVSSFNDDRTEVNDTMLSEIKPGSTSKEQILSTFGEPHGKALNPCVIGLKDIFNGGTEIWIWSSLNKVSTFGAEYAGQRANLKIILVVFDKNGIVKDIHSGEASTGLNSEDIKTNWKNLILN